MNSEIPEFWTSGAHDREITSGGMSGRSNSERQPVFENHTPRMPEARWWIYIYIERELYIYIHKYIYIERERERYGSVQKPLVFTFSLWVARFSEWPYIHTSKGFAPAAGPLWRPRECFIEYVCSSYERC